MTICAGPGRGTLGAAILAITCFAGVAHAEPPPSAESGTSAAPVTASPAPAPAPLNERAPVTEPPAETSKRTAWPWIIMGTGVALIVTAGVLEIHAVKEDDRREADEVKLFGTQDGPEKAALQKSAASHDDSAKSTRTASQILGTAGFLAVAGAVVLWFVEGSSSSSAPSAPAAAKVRPTLLPSFAPGYGGASFSASF